MWNSIRLSARRLIGTSVRALKTGHHYADGVGMTAQPEPRGDERRGDAEWSCPECGRPTEANPATGEPFRLCRSCYDSYVHHAGR
ncbi:MAG: hypothetical protein IVW52_06375 [Acidimicrobiales bacterium]|nr:hypothetical protein [Acidimicrobiales bacterium]